MDDVDGFDDELWDDTPDGRRVRAIRAARDAALTPSERLERIDDLCRQLAAIRPVREVEE